MRLPQRYFLTTLFLFAASLPIWAFYEQFLLAEVEPWGYVRPLQAVVHYNVERELGDYSVVVKHLIGGDTARYQADRQQPSASLYKLAVLYAAYRERDAGNLSFDEELVMTPGAVALVDDDEPSIPIGGATSVREAIFQMITVSDNSSAILLLGRITPATVNQLMSELGLTQTEIGTGDLALTSADDIALLLEKIYRGEGQTPASRDEMIDILRQQTVNDRLPRYLPPGTLIAHKTGELYGIRNDAGIVFTAKGPYIIVAMTENLPDEAQGIEAIARLSKRVYDHFARLDS